MLSGVLLADCLVDLKVAWRGVMLVDGKVVKMDVNLVVGKVDWTVVLWVDCLGACLVGEMVVKMVALPVVRLAGWKDVVMVALTADLSVVD